MILPTSITSLYNPISKRVFSIPTSRILIVLLIVGAIIRFYGLTYSSLWLDEIYSMIGSDPNTTFADVYQYSKHDQPPLFFILLHGWLRIFGYSDFAGRSLTCLFGILGILSMYFLGKQIKDEKLGLFAALITTINWFHTDISKEIRFYPLVFLLTALSFLYYLRSVKNAKVSDFALYALFTAALLNTHYFGLAVFLSQLIIFVLVPVLFKRTSRLIIGGLIAGVLAGLSILHYVPIIMSDLQLTSYHVKPIAYNFPFLFAWDYIKDPIAFTVYAYCIFLAILALYKIVKEKRLSVEYFIVIGWIFFSIAIPLAYSLIKVPIITSKYSTIVVPAIFIVIGSGFKLFKSESLKSYCVGLIIISGLIVLFFARPPYKPRRGEDWREVAGYYFNKHNSGKEVIFSQHAWFHGYYFKKFNLTIPYDQNNSDFTKIVSNTDQLSLLVNDRYTEGNDFLPEQKKLIEQEFDLVDSVTFKQTKAYFYLRKD